MHESELHLPEPHPTERWRKVSCPESLLLHPILKWPDGQSYLLICEIEGLEREHFFSNETAHPFQFRFELWLGGKVPRHRRLLPTQPFQTSPVPSGPSGRTRHRPLTARVPEANTLPLRWAA